MESILENKMSEIRIKVRETPIKEGSKQASLTDTVFTNGQKAKSMKGNMKKG